MFYDDITQCSNIEIVKFLAISVLYDTLQVHCGFMLDRITVLVNVDWHVEWFGIGVPYVGEHISEAPGNCLEPNGSQCKSLNNGIQLQESAYISKADLPVCG